MTFKKYSSFTLSAMLRTGKEYNDQPPYLRNAGRAGGR